MLTIILFVLLLLIMLIVGVLAGRKANEEGFQIYNNKLPARGFIASYIATFIGAGFFIVGTAYAYQFGLSFLWYAAGSLLGITVFGFYSFWLRKYSVGKKFYNLPDLIKHKFGVSSAKLISVILLLLIAGDLAVQLISGGKILDILGIAPYNIAVGITIVVIAVYLLTSGFKAVIWTDFVLAILIGIITLFLSYISYAKVDLSGLVFDAMPIGNIIGFFLFGLFAPYSFSTYYQRIFAAKSAKSARRSTWIGGGILVLVILLLSVIGFAARKVMPVGDADMAFIKLLMYFGSFVLSFGALVLWSALMSTADTMTFVGSQILVNNVLGLKLTKKNVRWSIIFVLLAGLIISLSYPSIVGASLIFFSGGMIIAPIGFFQWFMKLNRRAVNSALIVGVLALIGYIAFVGLNPTLVGVTFISSTITLMIVHFGEKLVRAV